jgi:preprotein translocase subunit SecF
VLVLGAEILGAVTLEYFGLALLIGLTSGAYSSIFIASPLLAMEKEHEERYRRIRERLESRGSATLLISPAAVAAGALSTAEPATSAKRRRSSGAALPRPATLRPRSARGVAAQGAALEMDGAAAVPDAADAEPKPQGPRPPTGAVRPPAGTPRAGTPARRPASRPRKKGKRR